MTEAHKYHQLTLVCKQMNSLASGKLWDIFLIQKLKHFVNKLVRINSTCKYF